MYFENLPNELFYEIFGYFNGFELYKTFSNLNTRFQNLIATSFLNFKLGGSSSYSQLDLQRIVEPNRHRTTSLCLKRIWNDSSAFTTFTIDSSFSRLESLAIYGIKSYDILPRLSGLISLPYLFSLILDIENHDTGPKDFSHIYRFIFSLATLKYNKVFSMVNTPDISLTIATNIQFSAMKYLNIEHSCKINDLITMLSYTPRLCRLGCREVIESIENINEVVVLLPDLTDISFRNFRLRFDVLEIFIKKIRSQLQQLRITTCWGEAYLDANRWERLFQEYIPQLRKFHFDHQIAVQHRSTTSPYYRGINQFLSSFWVEQGWSFQLKIYIHRDCSSEVTYSIRSDK